MKKHKRKFWVRITPLYKADRSFDLEFWQAQGPAVRFRVAFDMLKDFYRMRGKKFNASTFRLQRTVEHIKQA